MNPILRYLAPLSLISSGIAFAAEAPKPHLHTADCSHEAEAPKPHLHTADCSHEAEEHAPDGVHVEKDAHVHGPSCSGEEPVIIEVDPRVRSVISLRTQQVAAPSVPLINSIYGFLMQPAQAVQNYVLPAAGRIDLKVAADERVKAGDLLYLLESPSLSEALMAKNELTAELERARRELAIQQGRSDKLHEAGVRKIELEESLQFKQAELAELLQKIRLSEDRLRILCMGYELRRIGGVHMLAIVAKQDGIVRNLGVSQGSWGEQGSSALSMSGDASLEIVASVYSGDDLDYGSAIAYFPVGQQDVAVSGSLRIASQIDTAKQTRSLYFKPSNLPEGAQAGQLCRIDLYGDATQLKSVVVPDSAIVKHGINDIIFIELGEGRYLAQKVQLGESRRGMSSVSGLPANCKIVVQGGYELKFAISSPSGGEARAAGHFHADGKFHEGEH